MDSSEHGNESASETQPEQQPKSQPLSPAWRKRYQPGQVPADEMLEWLEWFRKHGG